MALKTRNIGIASGLVGAVALAGAWATSAGSSNTEPAQPTTEIAAPATIVTDAPAVVVPAAVTDSDTPAETFQVAVAGYPVALKYGPGISATAVQIAGRTISDAGCPTTMESGGRPNNVKGTVNGQHWSDSDPDAVARWAIQECTSG